MDDKWTFEHLEVLTSGGFPGLSGRSDLDIPR